MTLYPNLRLFLARVLGTHLRSDAMKRVFNLRTSPFIAIRRDATRQAAGAEIPRGGEEQAFREYIRALRAARSPRGVDRNRGFRSTRAAASLPTRSSNLGRWTELVRCPGEVPRIALTRMRRDKAIPRQWNYADCRLESISIGSAEHT